MAEKSRLLYGLLGRSLGYRSFQGMIGARAARERTARDYFQIKPGMRVLDLGCGTADFLEVVPDAVSYTGIDFNERYIDQARQDYGHRGTFLVKDVNDLRDDEDRYDLIMAQGLLHHLDNEECKALLVASRNLLAPEGRFMSLDGCYTENQNPIARFLLNRDRGGHVRAEREYADLASAAFSQVQTTLINDLLRVPYTHVLMVCRH
jgi:cyclopropane fatty-acyl-phospholipid synthase-like methyltransferase